MTRETLEAVPARALTFLRAAGTSKAIRALLAAKGYAPADQQEGWALLHRVSGLAESGADLDADVGVRDAMNELDNWDEDGFRLVRAALTRSHPAAAEFVLCGLGPATGAAAVLSVKNLLDRLDALEGAPARQATREADRAALATLAKRGLHAAERARLRGLVERAQAAEPVDPADASADAAAQQSYLADLTALRAWLLEWADTARVAVKRKDYLIRLGLAKRKAPAKTGGDAEPDLDPGDD